MLSGKNILADLQSSDSDFFSAKLPCIWSLCLRLQTLNFQSAKSAVLRRFKSR